MRIMILSVIFSFCVGNAQAQPISASDILTSNLGKASGSVKEDPASECDIEISDTMTSGKVTVLVGIYAYSGLAIYPDDSWEMNDAASTLIYYADSQKNDSVNFIFDSSSKKILSYTLVHQHGAAVGNTCVLNK